MADIIKSWPSFINPATTAKVFSEGNPPFGRYYFSLGRRKPKDAIEHIWIVYRGRIIARLAVEQIVVNDGSLPVLRRLNGEVSAWQPPKDAHVAVCRPPVRIRERVFHESRRGWTYFDFDTYRETVDARFRV
jgi:hypothetical protein